MPAAETCNGLDDDCDGLIDEGGVCPCDVVERDGHAYMFCGDRRSWGGARLFCQSNGYELARIGDAAEDAWLYQQIAGRRFSDTWVGLNDQLDEGRFVWNDGDALNYTHWDQGEPNNGGNGGEDCGVVMTADGRQSEWDDRACDSERPSVCETSSD